jgi:hypothetical protein
MSILSAAAGWYNADVVPRDGWYGGSSSSMPAAMTLTVRPAPGADRAVMSAIVDGLRFEVDTQASGSAEQYFTSRRRRS